MKENFNSSLEKEIRNNQRLISENNRLLKKIYRNALWSFWIKILWFVVLIGLPFALYFYILEPYFSAFGSSYLEFSEGMQEIPGLKYITEALEQYKEMNTPQ